MRDLFAGSGFRRLLAVRLLAQFGDGIFQASLAGAVLFNPEQQARASTVAAGFTVLLLPYSLVGPFAGVLLDRWSRQRVLARSAPVRMLSTAVSAAAVFSGLHGVPLYVLALISLSLARFVLSALSAAQPHVVRPSELATANAFGTTAGTVATTLGGVTALAIRSLAGDDNHGYGVIGLSAVLLYLASGWAATRFDPVALGPDESERAARETVREVAGDVIAGARHVRSKPAAFDVLVAIGMVRLCHGVTTVCAVLLYRNYFHDEGVFKAGLSGLLLIVVATAIGGGLAALVTPRMTRRIGMTRWVTLLIASSAVVQLALVLPYKIQLLPFAFVLSSLSSQGIQICTDTTIQHDVDDEFQGRVFSYYDALFNLTLVIAAVLVSLVLPEDGRAPAAVFVIAATYFATSAWFAYQSRSSRTAVS